MLMRFLQTSTVFLLLISSLDISLLSADDSLHAAQQLAKNYCVSCHSGKTPESGLVLDNLEAVVKKNAELWQSILRRHDIFYFNFRLNKKGTVKVVRNRRMQVRFSHEDWGRFSNARKSAQLAAYLKEDLDKGFQSTEKPLCRFHWIRFGAKHSRIRLFTTSWGNG